MIRRQLGLVVMSLGTSTKLLYVEDSSQVSTEMGDILGYTVLVFSQTTRLLIPLWVGEMSTSDGYGYH